MNMFKGTGVALALASFLIAAYEFVALVTPLPTISRITQGLRDDGHVGLVFVMSCVCVCIFALFGAWLYYHLNFQPRSGH